MVKQVRFFADELGPVPQRASLTTRVATLAAQVSLRSSEGEIFNVSEDVALCVSLPPWISLAHERGVSTHHSRTGCPRQSRPSWKARQPQNTHNSRVWRKPAYLRGPRVADCEEAVVPLPNVPGEVLAKVIVFCKFTVTANGDGAEVAAKTEDEVKAWQAEYLDIDNAMLFNLIVVRTPCRLFKKTPRSGLGVLLGHWDFAPCQAANYMNIKALLDLTAGHVAKLIKGARPPSVSPIEMVLTENHPWAQARRRIRFARCSTSRTTVHKKRRRRSGARTSGHSSDI